MKALAFIYEILIAIWALPITLLVLLTGYDIKILVIKSSPYEVLVDMKKK